MATTTLQQQPYPILLGEALAAKAWRQLLDPPAQLSVVVDENTAKHCWPKITGRLPKGVEPVLVVLPAGEQHKTLDMVQYCWQQWLSAAAGRDLTVLALGGGVVTDLVHFAAATYKRGVRCVLAPTSLLGMVDAAVGGKTGINLGGYKNTIGTFAQPAGVLIDTRFLQTLPERELLNGLAESIKHGIIEGKQLWQFLRHQPRLQQIKWLRLVQDSLQVKLRLVKRDFTDKGIRQLLNFGHTFGHALEAWALKTEHPLHHGEAVAIGMVYESWLAHHLGMLSKRSVNAITRTIQHFFGHLHMEVSQWEELTPYFQQDKKQKGGRFAFVLPQRPGKLRYGITDIPEAAMEKAFLATQSIFPPSWA